MSVSKEYNQSIMILFSAIILIPVILLFTSSGTDIDTGLGVSLFVIFIFGLFGLVIAIKLMQRIEDGETKHGI